MLKKSFESSSQEEFSSVQSTKQGGLGAFAFNQTSSTNTPPPAQPSINPQDTIIRSIENTASGDTTRNSLLIPNLDTPPTAALTAGNTSHLDALDTDNLLSTSSGQISNPTGIPDELKAELENYLKLDLSAIRVHLNSDKPTEFNVESIAIGNNIYMRHGEIDTTDLLKGILLFSTSDINDSDAIFDKQFQKNYLFKEDDYEFANDKALSFNRNKQKKANHAPLQPLTIPNNQIPLLLNPPKHDINTTYSELNLNPPKQTTPIDIETAWGTFTLQEYWFGTHVPEDMTSKPTIPRYYQHTKISFKPNKLLLENTNSLKIAFIQTIQQEVYGAPTISEPVKGNRTTPNNTHIDTVDGKTNNPICANESAPDLASSKSAGNHSIGKWTNGKEETAAFIIDRPTVLLANGFKNEFEATAMIIDCDIPELKNTYLGSVSWGATVEHGVTNHLPFKLANKESISDEFWAAVNYWNQSKTSSKFTSSKHPDLGELEYVGNKSEENTNQQPVSQTDTITLIRRELINGKERLTLKVVGRTTAGKLCSIATDDMTDIGEGEPVLQLPTTQNNESLREILGNKSSPVSNTKSSTKSGKDKKCSIQ